MSILLRAEDEPVASRVDYWRHLGSDTIAPFGMRMPGGPDFRAQILTGDLGAVRVVEVTGPSAELFRTARHIRRSDPELYKIAVQVRGHMAIEQDGREALLGPGDLTLLDLSRPGRWANSPGRVVTVAFPRALLPLRHDQVARLRAVRISGDEGVGGLASRLARELPTYLDDAEAAHRARLGTAVLDLLTVALAARLDRGDAVPPDTRQRALLLRIHAFIEERLGDPELSPGTIAGAHHISVRYLYKLFEAQGTTVAGWLRHRRLERCRRDLLNPALAPRPASAIGARWGLVGPAHFSRVFRAAYGLPPSEYRLTGNGSSPHWR